MLDPTAQSTTRLAKFPSSLSVRPGYEPERCQPKAQDSCGDIADKTGCGNEGFCKWTMHQTNSSTSWVHVNCSRNVACANNVGTCSAFGTGSLWRSGRIREGMDGVHDCATLCRRYLFFGLHEDPPGEVRCTCADSSNTIGGPADSSACTVRPCRMRFVCSRY